MDNKKKNKTSSTEFEKRRMKFRAAMKNSVAVFPSASSLIRNSDVHHPFRQESHFYYLTGFEEPQSICLLTPDSKLGFQMFVQPKDPLMEMWEGKVHGPDAAKKDFGADAAYPSTSGTHFEDAFIKAIADADALYYRVGLNPEFDLRMFELLTRARKKLGRTGRSLWPILDPDEILGEMRLIKSPFEIEAMSTACEITAEAHRKCMQAARPGMNEAEIEALLFYEFRKNGAQRLGYGSIVASEENACCLHYKSNNRKMKDGDLLLIDAGAEYGYFSSDITRTFPVNGTFSAEQKAVYNAVLEAQLAGISAAQPGKTLNDVHEASLEVLVENLKKLKVLSGPTKSLIKKTAYKPYYPHGIGHWLGMDVHDVGRYYIQSYDNYRPLKPGMIFTVEPGLYFSKGGDAPAKYKTIGVRIEDDILITPKGNKTLTGRVPKEVDEIESLCQSV